MCQHQHKPNNYLTNQFGRGDAALPVALPPFSAKSCPAQDHLMVFYLGGVTKQMNACAKHLVHVPGTWCPVSEAWYLVHGTKSRVHGTNGTGTGCWAFCSRYEGPGTRWAAHRSVYWVTLPKYTPMDHPFIRRAAVARCGPISMTKSTTTLTCSLVLQIRRVGRHDEIVTSRVKTAAAMNVAECQRRVAHIHAADCAHQQGVEIYLLSPTN